MDVQLREATADEASPFKLYHYNPTTVGAMIFVLLFSATTILHFWQLLRSRCWFAIPLAIGGISIGYASRFASGKESPNWTLTPYIIQAILLLVAPALFAASIYMELAPIIVLVDGESRA
ncbi:Protoporphyrin uptake protein 1 [Beauveria bassiana]|uniref:Protoporphyrin uptake protein 1 n=1 Tax=Beauveria bassiana TaxID=176275 RepID=A0A2N6NCY2_BEABA|nr:Protoporphyrin uptake protein 1 [Beauveria bassiana]